MLTRAMLLKALEYNPGTGEFLQDGKPIGHLCPAHGRCAAAWHVYFDGKMYLRGRLAWFWMTGRWPSDEIDHADGNRLDDRWENLREATRQQNNANRRPFKNNRSGRKGVYFRPESGKWRAMISVGGRNRSIGHFDKIEDAAAAYADAARSVYGEFARF